MQNKQTRLGPLLCLVPLYVTHYGISCTLSPQYKNKGFSTLSCPIKVNGRGIVLGFLCLAQSSNGIEREIAFCYLYTYFI